MAENVGKWQRGDVLRLILLLLLLPLDVTLTLRKAS